MKYRVIFEMDCDEPKDVVAFAEGVVEVECRRGVTLALIQQQTSYWTEIAPFSDLSDLVV